MLLQRKKGNSEIILYVFMESRMKEIHQHSFKKSSAYGKFLHGLIGCRQPSVNRNGEEKSMLYLGKWPLYPGNIIRGNLHL